MARLKKLHLALTALLVTTAVVSSAQATVYDSKVRRHGGWYVEVEPFWAKATDSFLTAYPFAESNVFVAGDVDTTTAREHYFHPEYDWGYRVALGYDYPSCNCCNYGFSLEYTQYTTDDHKDLTGFTEESDGLFGALEPFGFFFFADATDVHAKYDYDFYSIDLLGHKNMTICQCVDVQWFAGARYVKLDQDWRQHFFDAEDLIGIDLIETPEDLVIDHHTKFNGVGPRVGFDAFFPVVCNFGVTTEVAGDLLFGCSKNRYNELNTESEFVDDILTITEIDEFHADGPSRTLVVPGLTGKVGLAYRATFRNCSSLVIEAGYRGSKYFGIADHSTLMNAQSFDETFNKDGLYHDYSISGPYISLSYHA